MKNNYASFPTPTPGPAWRDMIPEYRLPMLQYRLHGFRHCIEVVDAKDNGHIILRLTKPLSAKDRGTLLLDIEEYLKETIDLGLTVWLDPQGDKSSLRNLRGIEIKHE